MLIWFNLRTKTLKTPKTIKISKRISMIKLQHGCVYIGMELLFRLSLCKKSIIFYLFFIFQQYFRNVQAIFQQFSSNVAANFSELAIQEFFRIFTSHYIGENLIKKRIGSGSSPGSTSAFRRRTRTTEGMKFFYHHIISWTLTAFFT